MATAPINAALARLLRRAEAEDPERLAETFVDVGPLFARLSSRDNQIIFGRRGTGKTHALAYLAQRLRGDGDTVVSVDLRLIGSNGGIYNDAGVPLAEASTRLLLDVLGRLHEDLVDQVLENVDSSADITGQTMSLLDRLAEAITEVAVVGEVEGVRRMGSWQTRRGAGALGWVSRRLVPCCGLSRRRVSIAVRSESERRCCVGRAPPCAFWRAQQHPSETRARPSGQTSVAALG